MGGIAKGGSEGYDDSRQWNSACGDGLGKTVVCCNVIAERQVNTLILVDKAELMNQWIERLHEFQVIDEKLPKYNTKSGQRRNM